MNKMLELMQSHDCTKTLGDLAGVTGAWGEEVNVWIGQDWTPRAAAAGMRKSPIVMPSDVFARLSAEEMATHHNGLEMRFFEDLEEAKAWLKS